MGDISKHFNRSEFACKCTSECEYNAIDARLLEILEKMREYFGKPVIVNSGCRCPEHNFFVGSDDSSQHIRSKAADITIKGVQVDDIFNYAIHLLAGKGGIGIYDNFIHIDVREETARWDYRLTK